MNAGTDRYFKYLKTTKYISQNPNGSNMGYGKGQGGRGSGGNGSGSGGNSSSNTTEEVTYTVSEDNSFAISNVEINLSLMWFIGQFSIEPSGSAYFPTRGDDRSPYGYWQLNLNYWFK